MKLRTLAIAGPLMLLVACSGSNDKFTISTGTYNVSSATPTSAGDGCDVLSIFTDPAKAIDIDVTGTTATFNLTREPTLPTNAKPTATINGNALDALAQASFTSPGTGGCLLRITNSITGEITANDDTALTLTVGISEDAASPGACAPSDVSTNVTALPCTSGVHFLGKKPAATP